LARVFFSSPGKFLVRPSCVEFGDDVVDSFVNVELFAAEHVDECRVPVGESVYADVTLRDYDETADSPLRRVLRRAVDERVRRADLVHPDDVG